MKDEFTWSIEVNENSNPSFSLIDYIAIFLAGIIGTIAGIITGMVLIEFNIF